MNNNTVFFGYISFLRENVDAAVKIMSQRQNDYLWICFNPSRMVQDGPTEEHPNMSFSVILDTDDEEDIVSDMENIIRQLPFLSCTLVVENNGKESSQLITYRKTADGKRIQKSVLLPSTKEIVQSVI